MKHVTWPIVVVVVAVLAALAVMFGLEQDPAMRQRMLGYFDSVVPFILGLGAGAGAGAAAGYAGGYLKAQSGLRAEMQGAAEARRSADGTAPAVDAVRRAAEVVRVAAEESDRATDAARAAATGLRIAAEEGRAVADLQRSLLAEIRRNAGGANDGQPWPAGRGAPAISVQR